MGAPIGSGLAAAIILLALAATATAGPLHNAAQAYALGDHATEYRIIRPLAEQGRARARYILGGMYVEGRGVPQDYSEALKWFRLAAEQGEADAQCVVANLYVRGEGVQQDYVQAHMWFNLASARSSDPDTRRRAAEARDMVAKAMSPGQVALAQRLAREWRPRLE